jgi:hypothetical protein
VEKSWFFMANDCVEGYYKTVKGKTYGPYIRKKRGKCKFTAKDITRLMIHARLDGVTDSELLHAWGQSTNNKSLICALSQFIQIANMNIIIGAFVAILKGVLSLMKGLKILMSGKKSKIATSVLELVVPKKYWEELGVYLIYIGSAEVIAGGLLFMMRTVANDLVFRKMVDAACKNELYIMPINTANIKQGDGDNIAYAVSEFNTKLLVQVSNDHRTVLQKFVEDYEPFSFEIGVFTELYDIFTFPIRWMFEEEQTGEITVPPIDYSFSIYDVVTGKIPQPPPTPKEPAPPPIIPPH